MDITHDENGFLWVSTWGGLFRYDGYQFKQYILDTVPVRKEWHHLPATGKLMAGKDGNIWVFNTFAMGGFNGKLQVLDTRQDTFRVFDFAIVASPWEMKETMLEDNSGNVWVRSMGGLWRISTAHKTLGEYTVSQYQHQPDNPYSLKDDTVACILLDKSDRLWVATRTGLHFFDDEKDRITRLELPELKLGEDNEPINLNLITRLELPELKPLITGLCYTPSGLIGIRTWGAGLYLLDPEKMTLEHFPAKNGDAPSLYGNFIRHMLTDSLGQIWLISTDEAQKTYQLQRFDPREKKFAGDYMPPFTAGGGPLAVNIYQSFYLFADRDGGVWFNDSKNLLHYHAEDDRFKIVQDAEGKSLALHASVTFHRDNNQVLWIGTAGGGRGVGGLIRHAHSTDLFHSFQHQDWNPNSISSYLVTDILEDREKQLWIGTQNGGADRVLIGPDNSIVETTHYNTHAPKDYRIPDNNVPWLMEDTAGIVWLGTLRGAVPVHPVSGKIIKGLDFPSGMGKNEMVGPRDFSFFKTDPKGGYWLYTQKQQLIYWNGLDNTWRLFNLNDSSTTKTNPILVIFADSQENIWIGAYRGLYKYNREKGNFWRYLPKVSINSMVEAESGQLWVTGLGYGLVWMDASSGKILKRYQEKNNFPTLNPRVILYDNDANLWIGSDRGLIFFDPETEKYHLYDESSGLPAEDFNYPAGCKKSNGELAMPLVTGGFILFDPKEIKSDTFRPKTMIVDFRLFNGSMKPGQENSPLKQTIHTSQNIRLAHHQNVITLEYAGLHFANPEANQYAYKMEGVDKDWNEVGNRRHATYAGLQPGHYVFSVKAANHDGAWGEATVLDITILPPWWATWWAYGIYTTLTASILWGIYTWRKQRWQLKADLAFEHREAERLKELDSVKTKLYTNITHEFRTPLTVILGMVKQVKAYPREWYSEGLQMIERNGRNLLHLVNQMLDLSKLEAGAMPVHLVQGDVIAFLKYVLESFHSLAKDKNIALQFQSDREEFVMDYDPEKLREIVSNLVSNAIKFTPEGGNVSVVVEAGDLSNFQNLTNLTLAISDTGFGIPEEKLPHIFDRFYQADDEATRDAEGTGIGLALTKELVKLLGGEISVKSEMGKGTVFEVWLPVPLTPKGEPHPSKTAEISLENITAELPGSGSPFRGSGGIAGEGNNPLTIQPPNHLLIVEDNPDVVRYLQSILSGTYKLQVAANGRLGIEKAIETIPDIIISDVMMPEADGFELCETLKKDERTSHIPIILLTAKADAASRLEGLDCGADAYLAKPFDQEELLVRLRKMVELRKRLQERYRNASILPATPETRELQIEDAFMKKVHDILEAHLGDENYGVSDLCKALGMSRAQLYRKLHALTDQPIGHYLRSLRLHKAKDLLVTTKLLVSEIAYEVGFRDPSYFTRAFTEEFGENPSEVRK